MAHIIWVHNILYHLRHMIWWTIWYGPYDMAHIKWYLIIQLKAEQTLFINVGKDVMKISCLAFVAWKTYQTNGEWLKSKLDFISGIIKPYIQSWIFQAEISFSFQLNKPVTSMLVTDVEDQMCCWQVWDVGYRFYILRKSPT